MIKASRQKYFQSSPLRPSFGRSELFKKAFKTTIAGDVTSILFLRDRDFWLPGYVVS